MKPHEESLYDFPINEDIPVEYHDDNSPTEDVNEYSEGEVVVENPVKLTKAEIEALYAVPNKNKNQTASSVQVAEDRRQYSVKLIVVFLFVVYSHFNILCSYTLPSKSI